MRRLKEFRCQHCGKLFFKGDLKCGTIEIKCKNCKNYALFEGKYSEKSLFYKWNLFKEKSLK